MWLRSGVAAAVAQAGSYGSDSIPSLGISICHGCSPKKTKQKKKKGKREERIQRFHRGPLWLCLWHMKVPALGIKQVPW